MAKVLYTAHAHVTGGRDGNAKTTECGLELDLHVPKKIGGAGGGTNPEKVFAVRYAACLESALAVNPAARRHGHEQLQLIAAAIPGPEEHAAASDRSWDPSLAGRPVTEGTA
jgi:organic hydroperoxide reductase OsmC/OhrA